MPYKNHTEHIKHCQDYYLSHKKESRNRGKKYSKNQQKINKQILNDLKINGCADCGYHRCNAALEFHHVNPKNKKFYINMANLSRYSNKMTDELNKCILLCANCHREIENKRGK